jgi:hypothetical protein
VPPSCGGSSYSFQKFWAEQAKTALPRAEPRRFEVGVKRSVLAAGSRTFQRLLHEIFGDDRLAAMGTILWRIGLKVKAQGACAFGFVGLKSRQFTDFVPGHHRDAP